MLLKTGVLLREIPEELRGRFVAGMYINPCKSLQDCGDGNLEHVLTAHIIVSSAGGQASTRMQPTDPTELAEKWGVGLEATRSTLECTTQRGIRTVLHLSLNRRFRTNYRQLQYRRLRYDFLVKLFLPKPSPIVATSMPMCLSQILDGRVRFIWIRRGVKIRLSPCYLNGMECLLR